ncbi:MAG: carbohydrate binding family 9 domain-containing protein [Gemmatimonadetes bacterium]|nr:carbohydrate binding family 9 domain-containing protein [Gemmatimonadota bacterium]
MKLSRRSPTPLLTSVLLALVGFGPLAGQAGDAAEHDARPVAVAVRAEGPIRVDGRLDEGVWDRPAAVDGFTQIDPDEGAPSTQRTRVWVLYDDDALYIGARLDDEGEVIGRLGRRDMSLGDSDWFGVMLDSYHDHRTAFGFDVNPAGVKRDEVKVIESDDNSWDPVWDVATTVDEGGWTVEYRIPFSQLRFSAAESQTWGVQFERMIGRRREYSVSTFIPKSAQGGVPGYGHLTGLERIEPGRRLEVLPYVVARSEHVDPGPNPFRTSSEQGASAGVDLKYRVTSNLTLDATINPDFGQVEVDPAVINLGVYETRFDEKRPFFIEGSEIFDLNTGGGGQLFYTRRVGRTPQVYPPSPLADVPAATTILGAAKLSGRSGGGWSVGMLEALTAEETARYRVAPGGEDLELAAEPLTNYFVGRARRDLRGGASAVGGLVTAVNRMMDEPAAEASLHSAAYAGAVDFRHDWDRRRWSLTGALTVSHVAGSPEAITRTQRLPNHYFQRPDADHLDVDPTATSLTGASAWARVARQAGEHWIGSLMVATTTPEYEINDLGFNYRTDRRDAQANLRYRENQPGEVLRNWYIDGTARFEGNWDDQLIANWLTLGASAQTLDYVSLFGLVSHSLRAYDDRLTRGGPIAVRPASSSGMLHVSSDGRKPIQVIGMLRGERDEFDGWGLVANAAVRWRPSSSWSLGVGPRFSRNSVVAQYVTTVPDPAYTETYGARYIFAPLDFTELGLETRLDMAVSPTLSMALYAQPLLSSGDYGDAMYLERPATYDFAPYAGDAPDRDFNVRSLRGNAVLRWEWRRGSTLYVAWQQAREGYEPVGDFRFRRDADALIDTQPDNIFVVKVNYWLNP